MPTGLNQVDMPGEKAGGRKDVAARWGRALAALQKSTDRTNREVAAGLGYSENNYSRIINGIVGPPDLDRVLRVLEYFGVDSELFWSLVEAAAVTPRPGVDPEIERRLALAQALGEKILGLVREGRKMHQESLEQHESQQEG